MLDLHDPKERAAHYHLRGQERAARKQDRLDQLLATRPSAEEVQDALDWVEEHLSTQVAEAIAANVPSRDAQEIGRIVLAVIDAYRTAQEDE